MLSQKLAESNPLATELAGYISTETNRLSALVTQFLDFARPLHADLAPRDITSVLDRALNDVAQFWKGAAVRVERQYEANLPEVPMDEGLCEQAFVNIIQNGYDAMSANGGVMRVSAGKSRRSTPLTHPMSNASFCSVTCPSPTPGILFPTAILPITMAPVPATVFMGIWTAPGLTPA